MSKNVFTFTPEGLILAVKDQTLMTHSSLVMTVFCYAFSLREAGRVTVDATKMRFSIELLEPYL